MAQKYFNSFDAAPAGPLSDVTNIGSATWQIGTVRPVSGTQAFTDPHGGNQDECLITAIPAQADMSLQYSQVYDGNGVLAVLRSSADGQNQYILNPFTGGLYYRVAGSTNFIQNIYTPTVAAGTAYDVYCQVQGNVISATVWPTGLPRPETASGTYTDAANRVTAAGYAGFYLNNGGGQAVDNVYVGDPGMFYAPASAVAKVGMIGDSITRGTGASNVYQTSAAALLGRALQGPLGGTVLVNAQGVSAASTADWLPTSTTQPNTPNLFGTYQNGVNGAGSVSTNLYNRAKSAFLSTGVTHVLIMLGANDARADNLFSAATYAGNMSAIVTQLRTDFPGVKIILVPPYYIQPGALGQWTSTAPGLLASYGAALAPLADNATVFVSPTSLYTTIQANPYLLTDGVHPSDAGHAALAVLCASALTGVAVPSSGLSAALAAVGLTPSTPYSGPAGRV